MFPHERSLVERLSDAPFALVGINTDSDKDEYRREAEENGITWRSSWQGSTSGPIPTQWGVQGYPSLYLIDHEGRIDKIWLGNPGEEAIDSAVDALVERALAEQGSSEG